MKKILVLMLAFVMVFAVCSLTACGEEVTYTGEYKYENAWAPGNYYGVQVEVTVKGNKVKSVVVTSENTDSYTNLSASWADKALWEEGEEAFLASFAGMKVADVLALEVVCQPNGQPTTVSGMDYVTGATQSSGRVILAVQNALDNTSAPSYVYAGEYKYANAWVEGAFYGVKVNVTVKGNVITAVKVTSENTDAYTNLSASWADKALWEEGEEAFLASFAGMTVAEANAVVVACQDNGQPTTVTGMEYVTGATQSSGRVILAIQNALSAIAA